LKKMGGNLTCPEETSLGKLVSEKTFGGPEVGRAREALDPSHLKCVPFRGERGTWV